MTNSSHYDEGEIAQSVALPAARNVARRWGRWLAFEDLAQEMYVHLYMHKAWLAEIAAAYEQSPEEGKAAVGRIGMRLRRHGERLARKEKALRTGYRPSDEFFYDPGLIAQYMPAVVNFDETHDIIVEIVDDGQPRRKPAPAEGGNLMATIVDIKRIYDRMPAPDQQILEQYYGENMTFVQIGEAWSMSKSWAEKRVKDLLTSIVRQLGGESPW